MRLIDADELERVFVGKHYGVNAIKHFIKMQPTIDAIPVKHGRWEWIGGYGYQYRCSECIVCAERPTNYCPNCGAYMMDGENDEID